MKIASAQFASVTSVILSGAALLTVLYLPSEDSQFIKKIKAGPMACPIPANAVKGTTFTYKHLPSGSEFYFTWSGADYRLIYKLPKQYAADEDKLTELFTACRLSDDKKVAASHASDVENEMLHRIEAVKNSN